MVTGLIDGATLRLAVKTLHNVTLKWQQLYEQTCKKQTPEDLASGVAACVRYFTRCFGWTTDALNGVTLDDGEDLTRLYLKLAGLASPAEVPGSAYYF